MKMMINHLMVKKLNIFLCMIRACKTIDTCSELQIYVKSLDCVGKHVVVKKKS